MPGKKQEKAIEMTIDEEGGMTLEAEGYTDGSCRTATEAFEKALGSVGNRNMKTPSGGTVQKTVKVG